MIPIRRNHNGAKHARQTHAVSTEIQSKMSPTGIYEYDINEMHYDQLTLQKRDSGSLSDLQVQAEIRVDVSPSPTKIKR